jgi:hypothetical protein
MRRFTLLAALTAALTVVACTLNRPFTCREMTWSDPTGGQVPPQHLDAETAVLWSETGWALDNTAGMSSPVTTPCGDQLPCAKVVGIILDAGMGRVSAVERCAVKWVPASPTSQEARQ